MSGGIKKNNKKIKKGTRVKTAEKIRQISGKKFSLFVYLIAVEDYFQKRHEVIITERIKGKRGKASAWGDGCRIIRGSEAATSGGVHVEPLNWIFTNN